MKLASLLRKRFKKKFLSNVNNMRVSKKRALLVYLTEPFILNIKDKRFRRHLNRKRNLLIADVFDKFGYSVDVINFNDIAAARKINKQYDVLFGLGLAFEYLVKNKKCLFSKTIYFATGAPVNYQNRRERERIRCVNNKYRSDLKPVRLVEEDNSILYNVDNLLVLGGEYNKELFKKITKVPSETICGNLLEGEDFYVERDFEKIKNNFLFLTGKGKVLCSLDLVFEVFLKQPEWKLFVCGDFQGEEDFLEIFLDKIKNSQNIYLEGWVDIHSDKFSNIVSKCGAIVMPVVSGALNGSVLIGMSHGLIPITTKDSGIDMVVERFMIKDLTERGIISAINDYRDMCDSEYREYSREVHSFTRTTFSEKKFVNTLTKLFKKWEL